MDNDILPSTTNVLLAITVGVFIMVIIFIIAQPINTTSYSDRFTAACTAKNGVTVVSANPGTGRYKCVSKEALIAVDL